MILNKIGYSPRVLTTNNYFQYKQTNFSPSRDSISFEGRKSIGFYEKGILHNAINRSTDKEKIKQLLKQENGVYKYKPFETFEILTQIKKPNFADNLEKLEAVSFIKYKKLPGGWIADILAVSDGTDVDKRIDIMQKLEKFGAEAYMFQCAGTFPPEKLEKAHKLTQNLDEKNKKEIFAEIREMLPTPDVFPPKNDPSYPFACFLLGKKHKDSLQKAVVSGKYSNLTLKDLEKLKNSNYDTYVTLNSKVEKIPQSLELLDFLIGLKKSDKRHIACKNLYSLDYLAEIYLQQNAPVGSVAEDLNKLFFGEPSKTLTKKLDKFTQSTGINLTADSNVPTEYIDMLQSMVPDLKERYIPLTTIMKISDLTARHAAGFNYNSLAAMSPKTIDFAHTVNHECAHYTHKYYIPGESTLDAFDQLDSNYFEANPQKAEVVKRLLRNYAATAQEEFVADLSADIACGRFHVVEDENGKIMFRKYLNPTDTATKEDLETLMEIYKECYGFPIKPTKAQLPELPYVEAEVPTIETPIFIRILNAMHK